MKIICILLTCYILTIITPPLILAPNRLYKPANEDAVHGSSLAWDLCIEHEISACVCERQASTFALAAQC